MESLPCGCLRSGNARSYTLCREGHTEPGAKAAPPPPKLDHATAVRPEPTAKTARQEQKARDAKSAGPRVLKQAGRYRLNLETGQSEPVEAAPTTPARRQRGDTGKP